MNSIKKYPLSDLYDMSSGISTSKDQAGHGHPFISFSTVFNNYFLPEVLPDLMNTTEKEQETYSVKEGDILVTRTSETIDELAMSCVSLQDYPKASYSGFTKRLRPKEGAKVYHKYMAFYLRGNLFRKAITNNAFMTLRASFNEDIFSFLNVYLPSYEEQVEIGDFLYNIERKIQINKKIINELDGRMRLIYDYWFVQFDFPNEEGEPYTMSDGKLEWNESLNKKIPKGWSSTKVGDLIEKAPSSMKIQTSDYLSCGEIPIIDQSSNFIAGYTNDSNSIISTPSGSIIFGDHTRVVKYIGFDFARGADGTQIIVSNNESVPQLFLYYSLLKFDLSNYGYARHFKFLKELSIIVPSKNIVDKFNIIASASNKLITNKIFENIELEKLRDWILPMFINGQANFTQ